MCTFLLWSDDVIFRTLTKNTWKITIQRKFEIIEFLAVPFLFLGQVLLIIFFLYMIYLHKLHFHIQYKEVYE